MFQKSLRQDIKIRNSPRTNYRLQDTSDKELLSKMQKELLNNSVGKQTTGLKSLLDTTSKIYRLQINTKDSSSYHDEI